MIRKRPSSQKVVFPHILQFLPPRVAHELRFLICDLDLFFLGAKLTGPGRFLSRFPFDMHVQLDSEIHFDHVHEPHINYTQGCLFE